MGDIDERKKRFEELVQANEPILIPLDLSEADVRAKAIDPLFREVLGWPESMVRREEQTGSGDFIDYAFGTKHRYFLLEAKRATAEWEFPAATYSRSIMVSSLMKRDGELKKVLYQVARYCQDEGFPFAVISNGRQLAVFRAIRTDISWLKGEALIFRSPSEMVSNFVELWDLLSYPAVAEGSLARQFSLPDGTPRHFKSVTSALSNSDETLMRNSLAGTLIPVLRSVFEDITDEQQSEILDRCYVYSKPLESAASEFILTISDLPPHYLKRDVRNVKPTAQSAGGFQESVADIARLHRRGTVMLLLGGVGSGKTTFLRQVRVKYCREIIEKNGTYFYVDFRNAPPSPPFNDFVYSNLRSQLGADPIVKEALGSSSPDALRAPAILKRLFTPELDEVGAMAREVGLPDDATIAQQRLTRLYDLSGDDREVVRRTLAVLEKEGRFVLIAFDNADQLDMQYQLQIFLFAQTIAADTGANVVVGLREEKYYVASQHGAFNAFHTSKFHIPSPRLSDLLALRLSYAIENLSSLLPNEKGDRVSDVTDLLRAVLVGGVGRFGRNGSSNVVRLLERVCLGNMRLGLELFRSFLQSGNTNVEKIIRIYRENLYRQRVPYYVPFHEFTKSAMLGDYRYFKEDRSPVLNVFSVSATGASSHLTSLRILALLMEFSERSSVYGRGFVELSDLLDPFSATFGDAPDAHFHLQRLVKFGLVECDTGVSDDLGRSRAFRASPAGEYYVTHLTRAFAYLDLVYVDTPISDTAIHARLAELHDRIDKDDRFERVQLFLRYLREEEERESARFPLMRGVAAWQHSFIDRISEQVDKEKFAISRNFARYGR